MEEENVKQSSDEGTMSEEGMLAGKFKNVDALVHAYGELEAEFTRRSTRLKALEGELAAAKQERGAPHAPLGEDELYQAATQSDKLRARLLGDYLASLKGVPLMGAGGMGVVAPVQKPQSITEAGALALGYLKGGK